MTIREKMIELLCENGMWPKDAPVVIDEMLAAREEGDPSHAVRWDGPTDQYPPQLLAVLWMSVRAAGLKWIDANCPEAFYRPMFVDTPTQENE